VASKTDTEAPWAAPLVFERMILSEGSDSMSSLFAPLRQIVSR
jgi:hypothetical protein